MPYSHFHDRSFHTHHRRPKGGNHYNAIRRKQKPWRVGLVVVLVGLLAGLAVFAGCRFNTQREAVTTFVVDTVEEQSRRQEERVQTRTVNQEIDRRTRVAIQETETLTLAADADKKQEEHERAIVLLINQERDQRGIREMSWDPKLQAIARAHSRDMSDKGYFDHTNKSGLDYRSRAVAAGYRCPNPKWQGVAENLFFGTRGYQSPQAAVNSWLDSPLHKRAMLDPTFSKAAIGVHEGYLAGYGQGYFTTLLLC